MPSWWLFEILGDVLDKLEPHETLGASGQSCLEDSRRVLLLGQLCWVTARQGVPPADPGHHLAQPGPACSGLVPPYTDMCTHGLLRARNEGWWRVSASPHPPDPPVSREETT